MPDRAVVLARVACCYVLSIALCLAALVELGVSLLEAMADRAWPAVLAMGRAYLLVLGAVLLTELADRTRATA